MAPCRRPLFIDSLWIYTMNRCYSLGARLSLAACAVVAGLSFALHVSPASAQGMQRTAPTDVVLGRMVVTAPPIVTMDGKPERLSPGSRIRDLNNMLVLSGGIVGQTLPVVYKKDPAGLVHEVWILTNEEYTKLGGTGGGAEGFKRFAELLNLIFGARK
jgi:hypothetical protein